MFYDDYLSLADDETTFGAKSDNYLKVYIQLDIRVTSLHSIPIYTIPSTLYAAQDGGGGGYSGFAWMIELGQKSKPKKKSMTKT